MGEVLKWVGIIAAIVIGIIALIPLIKALAEKIKTSIETKDFSGMLNTIVTLMQAAEVLFTEEHSGAEKKEFVMSAISDVSNDLGVTIDSAQVSNMIDNIATAANIINVKTEEKSEVEVTEEKIVIKEETKTEIEVKEEEPKKPEEPTLPTKKEILSTLVATCKDENGYIGHDATSNLDSKTDYGAGGKYTKYARDLDAVSYFNGKKQGYAWCCVMVCWLYYVACGRNKDLTLKLLGQPSSGNYAAGTGPLCRYLTEVKPHNLSDCQVGDIVLYDYSDDGVDSYDHVGVIYQKDSKWIYVAQGNAMSIKPDGGFGIQFIHGANHKNVQGIFRPHWDILDK